MIYDLNEVGLMDVRVVGGKAAQLGELVRLGLKVPPGFVIDVSEYDAFIKENKLMKFLTDYNARIVRSESIQEIEEMTKTIKDTFRNGIVSESLKAKLSLALEQLGNGPVAVRSSGTLEDSVQTSFAGQHESYLNVNGFNQVVDKVLSCWASIWGYRAIMYRKRRNIPSQAVSMAVIIQKLIVPDSAGVLFTLNPVTGSSSQMVIEGTWGLGEAIVSGKVSPDHWVIDAGSGAILKEEIVTKEMEVVVGREGIHFERISDTRRNLRVLGPGQINELYQIGNRISEHFLSPQDIEWTYQAGELYILQTRPITSAF